MLYGLKNIIWLFFCFADRGTLFQVFLYWAGRAFLASAHSYLHRTTRQVSYDQVGRFH